MTAPPLPDDAPTWDQIFALLHSLWSDAIDRRVYDREQKRRWTRLLSGLEREATRAGYSLTPR